jgi:predicted transcriptional regulator
MTTVAASPPVERAAVGYALALAGNGHPIVPLEGMVAGRCTCGRDHADDRRAGKHPKPGYGVTSASTDANTIASWFARWPNMNYGVRLDRLAVVDVDDDEQAAAWAATQASHGQVETIVVRSGRGEHWYLASGGESFVPASINGVQIKRGVREYVCGPGSVHASGREYAIHSGDEMAVLPSWIGAAAREANQRPQVMRSDTGGADGDVLDALILEHLPDAENLGRNNAVVLLAHAALKRGLSLDALAARAETIAVAFSRSWPSDHPFLPDEVRAVILRATDSVRADIIDAVTVMYRQSMRWWGIWRGSEDRIVSALVQHAIAVNSLDVTPGVRGLALRAGVSKSTADRALASIAATGMIARVGRADGDATVWKIVDQRVSETRNSGTGGGCGYGEGSSVHPVPLLRVLDRWDGSHDGLRHHATGKAGRAAIIGMEMLGGTVTVPILARHLKRSDATVRKTLNKLEDLGLVVRDGRRWSIAPGDPTALLEAVARHRNTQGAGECQARRDARERAAYVERRKQRAVAEESA